MILPFMLVGLGSAFKLDAHEVSPAITSSKMMSYSQEMGGFRIPLRSRCAQQDQRGQVLAQHDVYLDQGSIDIDLDNLQNSCYLADLYLGSPPQKLTWLFDTGSSFTWVLSKEVAANLTGRTGGPVTTFFDKSASTTSVNPTHDFKMFIQFGIGSVSGRFYKDQCIIGDISDPSRQLVIPSISFGYTETGDVFQGDFEVLCGLAYPALSGAGAS